MHITEVATSRAQSPSPLIVVLCGNNHRPSKSRALGEEIAERLDASMACNVAVYDLVDLGPAFGACASLDDLGPEARAVFDAVAASDALVVSSPTYKGSYPGIFKHFFDLLDPSVLENRPVLIAATGGGQRHALMVEHQMRPLFGFFMALVAPTAIYASDIDFDNGRISNSVLAARLEKGCAQFAQLISPNLQSTIQSSVIGNPQ